MHTMNSGEVVYDSPYRHNEQSDTSSTIANNYTVRYEVAIEGTDTLQEENDAEDGSCRGNDLIDVQKNPGDTKNVKWLSVTIRRLSNILSLLLVIGLCTTSYILYQVQADLSNIRLQTRNLNQHTLDTKKSVKEVIDQLKKFK